MLTGWNVASATRPHNFTQFVELVKSSAMEHNTLKCVGFTLANGFGCNNYGILLEGTKEDAEKFIHAFTLAVQPAKYGFLGEGTQPDPHLKEGQFVNLLEDN